VVPISTIGSNEMRLSSTSDGWRQLMSGGHPAR
jgi:hypothetical protein